MKTKRLIVSILLISFILNCFPINVFAASNAKTSSAANVRKGPGIYYDIITTLAGGTPINVLGKELGWYKVQTGNTTGYITETLVTITDSATASQYGGSQSSYEKLASYTTRFSASDLNRNHNMELAGTKNSVIVKPGAVFSFNRNTGNSTTTANGWRESIVLVNKERVKGIGGGICQTSSTIHSAVKQVKGLTILERHPHSLPVGYVPVENEAMVNYGSADFKFRNDLSYSIYIEVKINHSSGSLTATVYKVNPAGSPSSSPTQPSVTPPPEPPKPKDTQADVKRAYVNNMKTIMSNPKSILKTVKSDISEANVHYIEIYFTIEDIDKDGKYDNLIHYIVHTKDGTAYNYYLLYSFNTENMYLVKTYYAGNNSNEVLETKAYKNNNSGAILWYTVNHNTAKVTEIKPGFKEGKTYDWSSFISENTAFTANKTLMTYEAVVAFEKSSLFKPNTIASVNLDGVNIKYNIPPQTINDRIYIEMRSLFESLGYTITYDNSTRETVIGNDSEQFILKSGYESKEVIHIRDGVETAIAVEIPIKLVSDRTMFPLRFAGELIGYDIYWDSNSFTAYLTSGNVIDIEEAAEQEFDVIYDGRSEEDLPIIEANEVDAAPEADNAFEEISVPEEIGQPTVQDASTDEVTVNNRG